MDNYSLHINDVTTFGPFRLSAAVRLRQKKGQTVPLGGRTLEILIALVKWARETITRRELVVGLARCDRKGSQPSHPSSPRATKRIASLAVTQFLSYFLQDKMVREIAVTLKGRLRVSAFEGACAAASLRYVSQGFIGIGQIIYG